MRTINTIAALLAGGLLATAQPAQSERPNIIVVLADDMGFSEPGCYGSEIKTPTIDRLAAEGVRFSRFYVANCCGPSRASLNTGCYSWQVGQAPGANIFGNLTRNCVTLTQLLKSGGYKTCAVGRLDMVTSDDWHDPAQIARCSDRNTAKWTACCSGRPVAEAKSACNAKRLLRSLA